MSHKAVLQNIEGRPNGGVAVTLNIISLTTGLGNSVVYSADSYDPAKAAQIGAEQCAYADAAEAAAAPYQSILDSIKAGTEILLATSSGA